MRYFLVKYLKRPNGQMDEEVSVTRNLKMRDVQSSAVILDFKTQKVLQASMQGVTIPKDWERILGYYYQFYQSTIDRICRENGLIIKKQEPNEKNDTD